MGFGNIAVQAQVLSRRGERLPSITASAAVRGSSNGRSSHIFEVVYSDCAADLGGVSETARGKDLPSLHGETRKTAVGGSVPPPFTGISTLLSSNHLQTAVLALLKHQLNW